MSNWNKSGFKKNSFQVIILIIIAIKNGGFVKVTQLELFVNIRIWM